MNIELNDDSEIAVDMAPLIDCVFLLLIFFLVSTTMKRIDMELKLELPQAVASTEVQKVEGLVTLGIDAQGAFFWGTEPISTTTLRSRLADLANRNQQQRIRIDADKRVPYEYVLQVLDVCSFYGLNNLGLHTLPPRESR